MFSNLSTAKATGDVWPMAWNVVPVNSNGTQALPSLAKMNIGISEKAMACY